MDGTIILFGLISIYYFFFEFSKKKYLSNIQNSNDADESCYYRKKFARLRFIYSAIFVVVALYIILSSDYVRTNSIMTGLMVAWGSYQQKQALPLSGQRPKDIKNNNFILYLRGFSYDDYSLTIKDLENSKRNLGSFSEGHFNQILKQFMPVFAVGMTKELCAPIGAQRIYLNDKEWEQEVYQLMKNARLIVIHLNDSDSCIWEIIESNNFLNKVVFISSDNKKLSNVRKKLNAHYIYPLPIGIKENSLSYQPCNEKTFTILSFQNNDKSYIITIKQLMLEKFNLKRLIFTQRTYKRVGYMAAILFFIISPILYILDFDMLATCTGIIVIMFLPFFAIYNLLFIVIRNKKLK